MRGQLLLQEADLALQSHQLAAHLLRCVLATPPDRKDDNPQNYDEQDFHKDDWRDYTLCSAVLGKWDCVQTACLYAVRILTRQPIGPGGCAEAILFLGIPRGCGTTGHLIPVDGGLSETIRR
jgi:hypothetical protein